ncbi:MAG: serine hydrolase domain-containing protein [Xanthobacteraceae bacterium]
MTVTVATVAQGRVVQRDGCEQIVPWWSFTKTVLAAAALALVRDGRLHLDDRVQGRSFTLRQLLQHRAGVANYGGLAAYHRAVDNDEEPWSVPDLLRKADAGELLFAPGEGWDYSNIGYLFVRQMIETACGASLDDALQRLIFHPLDIHGPRIAMTRDDLAAVAMGAAGSYHPGWVYHGLLVGRLDHAALTLDRLLTTDLLPRHLRDAMCAAHPLGGPLQGRPWQTTGYGLGLMIGTGPVGQKVLGHTGGGPGSTIAVYRNDESGCTAAAFLPGEDTNAVESVAFDAVRPIF